MILTMELQKIINKKFLFLFLLFGALTLYFIQVGVNDYKNVIESKEKFQYFERLKVLQYINYTQYGSYGFRVLVSPSALSIFFINSTVFTELTSNVDVGDRLNIYNSFQGRALFTDKTGGFKSFSGIMLLLGALLVLYYGYDSLIHKDYLRYMSGFVPVRNLFHSVLAARMTVIVLQLVVLLLLSLLLIRLNGVRLSSRDLAGLLTYTGVLTILLLFFFMLGALAGSLRSRFSGFVLIIAVWFVFVFLIPGLVGAITASKAENIVSTYEMEVDKLKVLMNFEQEALKKEGYLKNSDADSERKLIESYWRNEFQTLKKIEKKLELEMEKNIRRFQGYSLVCPSTFYLSMGNEVSSRGYQSFIRFFRYMQDLKEKFVRFYLDKRYHLNNPAGLRVTHPQTGKVEPFIKNGENLFYSSGSLPRGFFVGLLLSVFYIVGLYSFSYISFKKSLRIK